MTRQFATGQEGRRLQEQARLDLAMGAAERNRAGQFATPRPLAEEILRHCRARWQGRRSVRFLEPCVGTGSFYSALRRVFPGSQVVRAAGYELDAAHAAVAEHLWGGAGLAVTPGDFLDQPPPREKYNLLVTNPPYLRHHHLPPARKKHLQGLVGQRLGLRVSGLSGLYCYFLLLADAWLEDGGLSVWLIPSEFMDVNYGAAVKEYLTTRVRLLHIHRFCPSDVQFADALVSSAVVVFEKAKPRAGKVVFSLGGSLLKPGTSVSVPHGSLRPSDKWTQHTAGDGPGAARPREGALFGDLFTIRRGVATGNNGFFILPRAEAARLGLPGKFLRPILPPPRQLAERVIEAEADGFPQLDPQLALLDCRLPEAEVKKGYPGLWRYLEAGKKNGVHESYLTSRRTPWYSQEDRPPPPFLCTYMGRNGNGRKPFRFLWNRSQATAHNVYLLLYPKGVLREALTRDPALYAEVFAALGSLDTEQITGGGRVYGGGLYKLEPKELAKIPAGFIVERVGLARTLAAVSQRNLFATLEAI
jgi:methylase of polypeptide subunit release factors